MTLPVPLPDFLIDHPDGEIRFAGSRISLYNVVNAFNEGYSPELILGHFPTLDLLNIYKTVVFYLENRSAIDQMVREIDVEIEAQIAKTPPAPSLAELRKRLESRAIAEQSNFI